MATSPPEAPPRPSPVRRGRSHEIATAVVAVVVVLCAVVLRPVLAEPDRVAVVVDNPTAYDVNVAVRSADGTGRVLLGTVRAGAARSFAGVVDRGARWTVEFSYAGVPAPAIDVPRESLVTDGVAVPATAEARFREAGLAVPRVGPSPTAPS